MAREKILEMMESNQSPERIKERCKLLDELFAKGASCEEIREALHGDDADCEQLSKDIRQ